MAFYPDLSWPYQPYLLVLELLVSERRKFFACDFSKKRNNIIIQRDKIRMNYNNHIIIYISSLHLQIIEKMMLWQNVQNNDSIILFSLPCNIFMLYIVCLTS